MPQTKLQNVIFTIMMVLVMVYGMVVYNITLDRGALTKKACAEDGVQDRNTRSGQAYHDNTCNIYYDSYVHVPHDEPCSYMSF